MGWAILAVLGCAPRSVDSWHATLRVGSTSELVVESPKAIDPLAADPAPPARLWVLIDGPVEPLEPMRFDQALAIQYVENAGAYGYVAEKVVGSATLVKEEGVVAYVSVDFTASWSRIHVDDPDPRPTHRSFDGYLPVTVEYAQRWSSPPPLSALDSLPAIPEVDPAPAVAAAPPPRWSGPPVLPAPPPPVEIRYQPGVPPPPGYVLRQEYSYGLLIGGGAVFLGAYGITLALARRNGFENEERWLALPVVGPFLWHRDKTRGDGPSERADGGMYGLEPIAIAGPQIVGLSLVTAALVRGSQNRWLRSDLVRDEASLGLTPLLFPGGSGLGAVARF